jgi:hypothetical protein
MASNTIILVGGGIHKEGKANAAITPGDLVERMSTGNIRKHATAAGNAAPSFAIENEVIGKGIDDDYAANDNVYFVHLAPGSVVYARVAAAAAAIAIGDYLESAGNGTLRKASASAATSEAQRAGIVARALEAVDNSGGGSAVRIKAEVL